MPTPPPPAVGEVRQGYRYNGGNPASRSSWQPVSSGPTGDVTGTPPPPGSPYLPQGPLKAGKSEEAYFNNYRKADDPAFKNAQTTADNARRMEGLMKNQETGGIYSIPVLGDIVGVFDPEIRSMDALQSQQARTNRQPGEGAISDFDAAQFLKFTYGKDKPTATNRMIIQAQRIASDAAIEKRTFTEWYYNTYGAVSGAPEAWAIYARNNPIFSPESEASGAPVLNRQRQSWRQYFGAVRGPEDQTPSMPARDAGRAETGRSLAAAGSRPNGVRVDLTGLPPAQARAVKQYEGAQGRLGTTTRPWVVRNDADFDRIPTGDVFIAPDGQIRTKP